MKRFKTFLICILAVLPMIYTAVAVFFFLPETVAAHFGFSGRPDRYGSKYEAFIFPAIILGISLLYFLFRKFTQISSADDNDRTARNIDILDTVIMLILVLFNAMCVFFLIVMRTPSVIQDKINLIFVILSTFWGVVFIILGNILPKTKPNNIIGIRLSWSMDTDEHWYITNRAGGIAMVLAGLCTIITGLIVRNGTWIIFMILSLIVFLTVAILYSYGKIKKK